MCRAAVISIVLLLANAADTALLCRLWCHPGGAARPACQEQSHSGATAVVTSGDRCGSTVVGGPMLAKENLRLTSDEDIRVAVVLPGEGRPAVSSLSLRRTDSGRAGPHEPRPLVVALRL
jgi:hypothetical protein